MQRKNSILRYSASKKRAGMAMIMAIMVIVIIATIMALALALTSETTKRTTDIYLHEQAALYSKAAAEFALLNIAKNGCSNSYNHTFGAAGEIQFDANVTMQYSYTTPIAGCTQYITINTPAENGSVLMDIAVTLHDSTITSEPIRYFRRTIQKL
jgi:flagellar basal body-associated protein FliL